MLLGRSPGFSVVEEGSATTSEWSPMSGDRWNEHAFHKGFELRLHRLPVFIDSGGRVKNSRVSLAYEPVTTRTSTP